MKRCAKKSMKILKSSVLADIYLFKVINRKKGVKYFQR